MMPPLDGGVADALVGAGRGVRMGGRMAAVGTGVAGTAHPRLRQGFGRINRTAGLLHAGLA